MRCCDKEMSGVHVGGRKGDGKGRDVGIVNFFHLQYNHYIDIMRVRRESDNTNEGISFIRK